MFNKKFVALFVFTVTFLGVTSNAMGITKKIVVFSFQHVLADQQKGTMLKKIAQLFSRQQWREMPRGLQILAIALYKHLTDQVSIQQLIAENPQIALYEKEIYEIVTLDLPNAAMIKLLKKLKQEDITLVLATNKSEEIIHLLEQMYPELFNVFDFYYFGTKKHGRKPTNKFFMGLRQAINQFSHITHKEEFIYVDANKGNCDSAQFADYNVRTIWFISPERLEKNLIAWNYLSEKTIQAQ